MSEKKHIKVVGAVFVNANEEILCAQRPEGKNLALKWEFPGGKIEANETAEDALVREINEELDVHIKVNKHIDTTVFEYDFGIVELSTYYVDIISGAFKMLEHKDLKWVHRSQLQKLDWADADIPAIEKIINDA